MRGNRIAAPATAFADPGTRDDTAGFRGTGAREIWMTAAPPASGQPEGGPMIPTPTPTPAPAPLPPTPPPPISPPPAASRPASSQPAGPPEAGATEAAISALPGLAGLIALTGAGGLVGYRQARAGFALRAAGTGRFLA